MKIFVVIPGFNEEKYLEKVLHDILKITKNVVYIDDGSHDKSAIIAKKHLQDVLVHEVNLGKGAALKTGCEYAFKKLKADAVVFMDSDKQHNPSDLSKFIKKLEGGADVVFGVRAFDAHTPFIRLYGNKFASFFFNLLFGKYITDIPSGYKAITRSVYKKLEWTAVGYEVEIEIAARVAKNNISYEIVEIKTIYHDVDKGVSLLDALNIMKFLVQLKLSL